MDHYASPESDRTISEKIKPLGVNWLALVVTCYQDTGKNKPAEDILRTYYGGVAGKNGRGTPKRDSRF